MFRRKSKDPEPICGCDHHLAMHDPKTHGCHDVIVRREMHNPNGKYIGKQLTPCTCRQYVGPQPVDSFFVTRSIFTDAIMVTTERKELSEEVDVSHDAPT